MRKAFYALAFLIVIALAILLVPGFMSQVKDGEAGDSTTTSGSDYDSPAAGNPLKNMFGINAYEWNFLQNPKDLNDPSHIYQPKMDLIQSFTAVRHYLDWEKIEPTEGSYTFNPANNGGWNYDAIYERCKQDGILVLVCLKDCPPWIAKTYPQGQQGGEDVPAPYGLNREDPATYIQQARAGFQLAARYGNNSNVDRSLVKVNAKPRWTADKVNEVKVGMGLISYIECDNERDKWWKGKQAQQTGREYAANLSAFYDGNKGKLGKNAGVKTADPSIKVVMCGLATADVKFVRDMIDWCRTNRGYKRDGSIDLCFDVINYHLYFNDNRQHLNKQATRGIAPELGEAGQVADDFVNLAKSLPQHPEVWVTETGYDINPQSTQRAITTNHRTALETQADWILRSALLLNRHGIKRTFFYQLFDDNQSSVQYSTSGLADGTTLKRRPAAGYVLQTTKLMGDYLYQGTISQYPLVDVYRLGSKTMYVLVVPDEQGKTEHYTLNLNGAANALVHRPVTGESTMETTPYKTDNGKLDIMVTETPVFVEGN